VDVAERARARADVGAVCRLGKEAVDILGGASGGSSIYADVPMQRIVRDIQAVSMHALITPLTSSSCTDGPVRPRAQYVLHLGAAG